MKNDRLHVSMNRRQLLGFLGLSVAVVVPSGVRATKLPKLRRPDVPRDEQATKKIVVSF